MVAKLLFRVFMVLNFECSTHAQTCKLALSGKFVVGCGFLAIGTCKRERESSARDGKGSGAAELKTTSPEKFDTGIFDDDLTIEVQTQTSIDFYNSNMLQLCIEVYLDIGIGDFRFTFRNGQII